jgi:hypothetical protein
LEKNPFDIPTSILAASLLFWLFLVLKRPDRSSPEYPSSIRLRVLVGEVSVVLVLLAALGAWKVVQFRQTDDLDHLAVSAVPILSLIIGVVGSFWWGTGRRLARRATPITELPRFDLVRERIERLSKKADLRGTFSVVALDRMMISPHVFGGILSRGLALPWNFPEMARAAEEVFEEGETFVDFVILHELAHLKRRDHVWKDVVGWVLVVISRTLVVGLVVLLLLGIAKLGFFHVALNLEFTPVEHAADVFFTGGLATIIGLAPFAILLAQVPGVQRERESFADAFAATLVGTDPFPSSEEDFEAFLRTWASTQSRSTRGVGGTTGFAQRMEEEKQGVGRGPSFGEEMLLWTYGALLNTFFATHPKRRRRLSEIREALDLRWAYHPIDDGVLYGLGLVMVGGLLMAWSFFAPGSVGGIEYQDLMLPLGGVLGVVYYWPVRYAREGSPHSYQVSSYSSVVSRLLGVAVISSATAAGMVQLGSWWTKSILSIPVQPIAGVQCAAILLFSIGVLVGATQGALRLKGAGWLLNSLVMVMAAFGLATTAAVFLR